MSELAKLAEQRIFEERILAEQRIFEERILAEQRIFEERILAKDPEIMEIIPYTLHGDLVCPIGDDINPDGTIMVPACICAIHKTAAGMRYFFAYVASEKRKSQIAAPNIRARLAVRNIRARLARVATVIMSAIYKN